MMNVLSDEKAYKKISKNPLKRLKDGTYSMLNYLNNNVFLHKNFHKNMLTQSDTTLAKCYELPKIHKVDVPVRPIVSLIAPRIF